MHYYRVKFDRSVAIRTPLAFPIAFYPFIPGRMLRISNPSGYGETRAEFTGVAGAISQS